jgi:hypothetical protein
MITNRKSPIQKPAYYDDVVLEDFFSELWKRYDTQLNQSFDHSSFDFLDKMGYHIWDDVDYEAENVESQYADLLEHYKDEWNKLTPAEKAGKLICAASVSPEELLTIIIRKEFDAFI